MLIQYGDLLCKFWSYFLVQWNTAEAIFKPNLLQTLGREQEKRGQRQFSEFLVRIQSSSIGITMSVPALVLHFWMHAKGKKGWVEP